MRRLLCIAILLLAAPTVGRAGPIYYTIIDLGVLPGGGQSWANSVNDQGVAAGVSTNGPVRWVNGVVQSLGTLPGGPFGGGAYDINAAGQIVGVASNERSQGRAIIWDAVTGMRDLGTLPGDTASYAHGINNLGWVIGTSSDGRGVGSGFVWDTTAMRRLNPLPNGLNSSAWAINDTGVIAGTSDQQAVVWNGGVPVPLPFLQAGDIYSGAHDINSSGLVVGYSDATGTSEDAVVWSGGAVVGLGYLPGDFRSAAWGVNDAGWVVGESQTLQTRRAFVWDGTEMHDLNTLIAGPNPFTSLGDARAISNSGHIVGYGEVGGVTHAFLLTPVAVSLLLSNNHVTGGLALAGSLRLSAPAGPDGAEVTLRSTEGATVPASVRVAPGESEATFGIETPVVITATSVVITATWLSASQTADLTVLPRADLAVTSISAPPEMASPGSSYLATDQTANQGGTVAAPSVTRFYLSLDEMKGTGDTRLAGARAVPGLDSATTSMGPTTVTIPSTLAPGTYFLLACADDTRVVAEGSELNNCLASGSTIQVVRPDLLETTVSDPPTSLAPGGKFTVTDTVLNPSGVWAGASTTRYYLSLNEAKDAGDVLLNGTRNVVALAAGVSSAGSKLVTVPLGTALGTYRLLACADDLKKVTETNEVNNCAVATTSLVVGLPDLVTSQLSDPPVAARIGAKISLTDTVINQGTAPTGTSSTRYYLSLDGTWSADDLLLTGSRSVSILQPGAMSVGSKLVTIPLTTPRGSYYVLACADDLRKVAEADEVNNCGASATIVAIDP
jgi:probable HAF family extracellular repeat protein